MSGKSAVAAVMDGVGPVSALATEMARLEAAMLELITEADGACARTSHAGMRRPRRMSVISSRPANCRPIGISRSLKPPGSVTVGWPVRSKGAV